jgi:hypothetical protein
LGIDWGWDWPWRLEGRVGSTAKFRLYNKAVQESFTIGLANNGRED